MLKVERQGDVCCVEAPAKINVGLRLLGKRPDGYHEIESPFLAVDLTDTLEATAVPDGDLRLGVVADGAEAPADESNLVLRAARLLKERSGVGRGAAIRLVKRIPAARGLGGGSSDAAATLVLLSNLWGLDWPAEELRPLAAELGSDVPFFLNGPLAIIRGRGERIEPVAGPVKAYIVLVVPPVRLATKDVYRASRPPLTAHAEGVSLEWITLLKGGHIRELGCHIMNDLEPAARELYSGLVKVRSALREQGAACVSMTGSGSAMYALVATREEAEGLSRGLDLGREFRVRLLAPWNDA